MSSQLSRDEMQVINQHMRAGKEFNILSYQERENESYIEISSHPCQDDDHKENK